jgi:Sigma-54 interaction domain
MSYPFHAAGGAGGSATPGAITRIRTEWRLELQIAGMQRTNLLLVGAGTVPVLLEMLSVELLNERILSWHPGEPLTLPSPRHAATFILHEVNQLSAEGQRELLSWLDQASGRIRVISTAEQPLLPMVKSGAFDEALYYRLNIICVDLGAQ